MSGAAGQASQFALRFYGTGVSQQDRVRIQIDDDAPGPDASTPVDVGAGDFTIEFWLRGTLANNRSSNNGGDVETFDIGWINGDIIVDRDIFGGSERKYGISIAGGFVRFGTSRGDGPSSDLDSTIEGSNNVLDDNWHHVACVRDSQSGRKHIYVDAVLDYSGAAGISTVDISYPDDGAPGQITPWGQYIVLAAEKHDAGPSFPSFAGYMDELRIWNVARSAAELAATYNQVLPASTPGLVGSYRFEEGSGTAIGDSSSQGSPLGDLIAGIPGNGEWVAFATNPSNTAPVQGGGPLEMLRLETSPAGLPLLVQGVLLAAPLDLLAPAGFSYSLEAPAIGQAGNQGYAFAVWSNRQAASHSFVVPAGGATLRAIYAVVSQATVQVAVPATHRNADYHPQSGQGYSNFYDSFGLCCGNDSQGPYESGLEFALPVPQGVAIDTATLRVIATADQLGSPTASVRGYDVADAPAFQAGSSTPLTQFAPLTQASVAWPFPTFISGQSYDSPDLAAVVEEVVGRNDWVSGNHLGLILDPAGTTGDQWRCFGNFISGNAATLEVTYGSGSTAGNFVELGPGLGGALPAPDLGGAGDLTPTSTLGFALYVIGGQPSSLTLMFVGLTEGALPLFGGTLYPFPFAAIVPVGVTDAAGTVALYAALDGNVPAGISVVLQAWLVDASGPQGFVATNGLRLDVP
jgi:hypothetical protein